MSDIHLTEVTKPVWKDRGRLFSYFGTFLASHSESDFRLSNLKTDSYQARLVIVISQLLTLPYVVNDYLLYGTSDGFWQLLGIRGFVLALSIAAWFLLSTASIKVWDRYVFGWSLLVAVYIVSVAPSRPPGYIGIIAASLLFILTCYLLIPLRLQLLTISAGAITLGHFVLAFWLYPIQDPVFRNTLVFTLIATNILGFFASRQLNYWKRLQFTIRDRLIDSERHYRTLIDASGSMVWTMLPDLTVDFVNKEWMDMTGRRENRLNPADWPAIVHKDDLEGIFPSFHESIERGERFESILRLRRHDGEYLWFLNRMLPLKNDFGEIEKWIGTTTDIHEHWMNRLALRESNAQLENALGRVRQLEKILSICSFCKKIRDENDAWQPLEAYISARSETRFSHGICHTCGVEHYGEAGKKMFEAGNG